MKPQNAAGAPELPDSAPRIAEGSIDQQQPDLRPSRAIAECQACQEAERDPISGLYHSNCKECIARMLSHGPQYFESRLAGKLRPAYMQALRAAFGDDWEAGHARVKHWAQRRAAK